MKELIEIGSRFVQNSNLAALWVDASLKSLIVLALAGGLCLCWRRASAATRHGIWFLAAISLLCLPLFSLTVPRPQRPLWSVSTDLNSANQVTLAIEFAPSRTPELPARETPPAVVGTETLGDAAADGIRRLATHFSAGWLALAAIGWIAGIVLVLSDVAVGRIRLLLIRRRAPAPRSAGWSQLLPELCKKLDLHRQVKLLQSAEDVMPMTWGWWRPVILLPDESDQWTSERLRVGLLHELAHVKRWDCLTQMITGIVCAIYWFNPLVWVAARRMRVERERACDDLVLNGGCRASDYATHLVEIARTFRRVPQVPAIAMARSSRLEQRVAAILDDRRNRNRIAKTGVAFSALAIAGLELLIGGNAMKNSPVPWSLDRSMVSEQLKRFVAEKKAQANAAAISEGKPMLAEFSSVFGAAEKGNWQAVSNIFANFRKPIPPSDNRDPKDYCLHGSQWATAQEILGAFEQFALGEEKYSLAFGKDVIASIPPGSIYSGGTDAGRFVITALCKSHANADPFFTLTQNALADKGYLQYLRGMYGDRIYIPTAEDHQKYFDEYMTDVRRRMKENKLKPGEDVEEVDGKMHVAGQVSVMALNGLLSKLIFDKNSEREFYLEESFPLDWMYPHIEPHGLILKINRQPLAELSDEVVQRDHAYWTRYIQPMIGEWLTDDTPVGEIAAFVEKVHVTHNLNGFKGDPRFVQNDHPQKLFSKLRSSIGGLYSWRVANAKSPAEKERMLKEADYAFRQALALCPSSPEVVFRHTTLLATQGRRDDAILVVESALKVKPENAQLANWLEQLKKMKKN